MQQARRIKPFPQPFALGVSERDRILGLSAWVSGSPRRLGTITSRDDLQGVPVQIIDLTEYTESRSTGHVTAFTAPRAIAFLRRLNSRF